MFLEKSAGVVIFRRQNSNLKFLLLHYPAVAHRSNRNYWDFVKGHLEHGETEMETVVRETLEEAGINDLSFVDGFREQMKYFFIYRGRLIFKKVSFYLAETQAESIILSGEHSDFAWMSYQDAYNMLSFKNAKMILEKANKFLQNKGI